MTQRNTASQTQAPGTPRTGGGYWLKKYILGIVAIFSVFTYVIIVYLTSMNIVHYLWAYSRIQSENEAQVEGTGHQMYQVRETAVVIQFDDQIVEEIS